MTQREEVNPLSPHADRTSDLYGQVGPRGILACSLGRTDPTRQERPDPTCPPRKRCDTISPPERNRRRAPMYYSEPSEHALPHYQRYRYTRAYKYPTGIQVHPPPVPSKIQQLDSQQQPTLELDWAYLVPHSPRNNWFLN
ncbi:hypothetical protein PIB30_041586 [Stylosanthes scabra]|uniref:Uncharacterized protein n=1 Tax=Stylosanthes scabra TaxID=79078 RepID=A0ABU6SEU9_9FABA|nr:hypothetical protein [Stylosanthes scabra]